VVEVVDGARHHHLQDWARGSRAYPYHDQLILVAFALITIGTYLYLFAFAREQYLKRNAPDCERDRA
jgi:hypothetical protein